MISTAFYCFCQIVKLSLLSLMTIMTEMTIMIMAGIIAYL